MTWNSIDFTTDTTAARPRDCIASPLLSWIADPRNGVHYADGSGRIRISRDKAARAVGIQPSSVFTELVQMQRRGSLTVRNLGEGDYEVTLTSQGLRLAEDAA